MDGRQTGESLSTEPGLQFILLKRKAAGPTSGGLSIYSSRKKAGPRTDMRGPATDLIY